MQIEEVLRSRSTAWTLSELQAVVGLTQAQLNTAIKQGKLRTAGFGASMIIVESQDAVAWWIEADTKSAPRLTGRKPNRDPKPATKREIDSGARKPVSSVRVPVTIADQIRAHRSAWKVPELMVLLSLSKSQLYRVIDRGQLPAARVGTTLRIDPEDAALWWERQFTA